MENTWQLQDAKNRFSQVVEQANSIGTQIITKHGKPAAVVISMRDYEKLKPNRRRILDVLRDCPVNDLNLPRITEKARDLEL